jgi:hypothetical protein
MEAWTSVHGAPKHPAWYSQQPRRQCVPAAGLRLDWSISQKELADQLEALEEDPLGGMDLRARFDKTGCDFILLAGFKVQIDFLHVFVQGLFALGVHSAAPAALDLECLTVEVICQLPIRARLAGERPLPAFAGVAYVIMLYYYIIMLAWRGHPWSSSAQLRHSTACHLRWAAARLTTPSRSCPWTATETRFRFTAGMNTSSTA